MNMNPLDLNKASETEQIEASNTISVEVTPQIATSNGKLTTTDYTNFSKLELTNALSLLIEKDVDAVKDEVEIIKLQFYKKLKIEVEELKKSFIENGGIESDFVAQKSDLEDTLKSLLSQFRAKKAVVLAQIEKEKEDNLSQKQSILSQMKILIESNEDVSAYINDFRILQQNWKTIGQIPQSASTEIWKQYNLYQESFWDLVKINNELREYDFKKNLESKTQICETAEKIANEADIVLAFQQLQQLHEEWHELGPVAREYRETIWNRFKDASTIINKRHQVYFEEIRSTEEENLALKTALCDKIEAFDFSQLQNFKAWDDATKIVLAWQDEWKTIGYAPRKVNQKIFERYRTACDAFFSAKGEYYKEAKNVLNINADKKKALCEQAEALKDSTNWKEAGEKFIALQKEWKNIGPVGKKLSDELWKRFITACDYFFEQKNKSTSSQKTEETQNLEKKKEVIAKIESFQKSENHNDSIQELKALMAEWNAIGHVPFKEKDKLYKEYKEAADKQFDLLHAESNNRRIDSFKTNIKDLNTKGDNKLGKERDKLVRALEHLKSEIATYENNIGFLTSSSKKGSGFIKEMERKIESLKEESVMIKKKINLIDEN